ncbi:hypothetical protein ABBQ32_003040 [Trebouxia sp. C0010 RCD-2024]
MVDLQKEQDVQSSYMVLPAEPNELLCSHCQMPGMVMVRLASVEQLEDWQTLLHSHLDCKPLAGVQVIYIVPVLPNIVHSVRPGLTVDVEELLSGIRHDALEE